MKIIKFLIFIIMGLFFLFSGDAYAILTDTMPPNFKKEQTIDNKQNNIENKELDIYKSNLRNFLFSNFPILQVYGIGTARVGFSISKDGKLINKRFISQSNNKSLNDALYHMLMVTSEFKNPPDSYLGEEIILEMFYNNGQYSFSYIKQ